MNVLKSSLESLRTELESDIMLCTTREQHIRMSQRLSKVVSILAELELAEFKRENCSADPAEV